VKFRRPVFDKIRFLGITLPQYPRLSNPISQLAKHYQVVVVGSGYGGSILSSRLSRAGMVSPFSFEVTSLFRSELRIFLVSREKED
jgi:hypothetical protein